mmetsp:Transcript_13037/g.21303  ORF Transcript_13037/g.21303 Transcript_13037/m.21303 type:complete len:218 (-) Transcript_13037:131-784(-)
MAIVEAGRRCRQCSKPSLPILRRIAILIRHLHPTQLHLDVVPLLRQLLRQKHLVGARDHLPKRLVRRCLRPPGLPSSQAVRTNHEKFHHAVEERYAQRQSAILAFKHGKGNGCGDAAVLVAAFDAGGDTFWLFEAEVRRHQVGEDEGGDARCGDSEVKFGCALPYAVSFAHVGDDAGKEDERYACEAAKPISVHMKLPMEHFITGENPQTNGANHHQ